MSFLDLDEINTVAAMCASSIADAMLTHHWNTDEFVLEANKVPGVSGVYFSYHKKFMDFLSNEKIPCSQTNKINALKMTASLVASYCKACQDIDARKKIQPALKHLVRVDNFLDHAEDLAKDLEHSCRLFEAGIKLQHPPKKLV